MQVLAHRIALSSWGDVHFLFRQVYQESVWLLHPRLFSRPLWTAT